jgi:hypothetical protein
MRNPYNLAADRINAVPEYRLSDFPLDRIESIKSRPPRVANGPQYHIEVGAHLGEIAQLSDAHSVLERMGAMLLLSSFIEGRIRAMYRERHAIMYDKPRPTSADEAREYAEAAEEGRIIRNSVLDKDSLFRQLCQLRYYEDIDENTFRELKLFTEVRNAMVHDAMYRVDAFSADLIHALLPMVPHLNNQRQNVRNRAIKERTLHESSPYREDYFTTLPIGTRIKRDTLFCQVAGSPSNTICAPICFGRPLYVIAQRGNGQPQAKFDKEELGTHDLWPSFIDQQVWLPIFRKVSPSDELGPEVEYLGYGHLSQYGGGSESIKCNVVLAQY